MDDLSGHRSGDPTRWVGVGRSSDSDAARAGTAAVAAAAAGDDPRLLVVFASDSYDLEVLIAAAAEAAAGIPLIGCSTVGEISASGPGEQGVVCVALGGHGFTVSTALVENASAGLREAGAEVAACLGDVGDDPHRILLLLTDGLAGDQQEVVRGAYSVAGAGVPLVGGCAGDDLKMTATFQFHGGRVVRDGVVAAAIGSAGPFGIGVKHGWRPVGDPMLVTRAAKGRVVSIDDRPALDVYLERLEAPAPAHTDPAAFTRFALTHPLGLSRRANEEHVRCVTGADFDERSLLCAADVPQGGLAWLMQGDDQAVLEATDAACSAALGALGGHDPLGLLVFDCMARRDLLGEAGIGDEIGRVSSHADGAPVAGFYTFGEIARTRGITGFHNQTLVVLAIG